MKGRLAAGRKCCRHGADFVNTALREPGHHAQQLGRVGTVGTDQWEPHFLHEGAKFYLHQFTRCRVA